jgi:hypothetical protein
MLLLLPCDQLMTICQVHQSVCFKQSPAAVAAAAASAAALLRNPPCIGQLIAEYVCGQDDCSSARHRWLAAGQAWHRP